MLLVGGVLSRDPVIDTLTGETVADVGLVFSTGYLAFAPVLGVLDHLSLLTDRQHVAVLLGGVVVFLALRGYRRLSGACTEAGTSRECVLAVAGFASVLCIYAFGVLGTRPMVSLQSHDPELVIVDFHSHTDASHDGRPGFDVEARREWHQSAGFDLAYLTDHLSLEAALIATGGNPGLAGDGLSILPGREVRYKSQHVLVLGHEDPTVGITDRDRWPTLIQTIPNDLSRVPLPTYAGRGGVHAIELVDADPRGLRQSVEDRALLLNIADSLDLAVVSGSNHHGWGRTAAVWTLVRVPDWQRLAPEALGLEVESHIRDNRADATRVVERRRLPTDTSREWSVAEVFTLPRLAWHVLTSLTPIERVAWLLWIGVATLILHGTSRPRLQA